MLALFEESGAKTARSALQEDVICCFYKPAVTFYPQEKVMSSDSEVCL